MDKCFYEIRAWTIVNILVFTDAIAAFMDGLVSQPETQPMQDNSQAPAPVAPQFFNPLG